MEPINASGQHRDGDSSALRTPDDALGGPHCEPGQPPILDLASAASSPWPRVLDLVLSAIAFVVHALFAAAASYGPTTAICGGLEAAILVLLGTRYIRVRPARLPWIELMFMGQYTNFGLAVAGEPTPVGLREMVPHPESFDQASIVALLSGLAMVASFWVTRRAARRWSGTSLLPKLDAEAITLASRVYVPIACVYSVVTTNVGALRTALLPVTAVLAAFFSLTSLLIVATIVYLARPSLLNFLQLIAAFVTVAVVMITTSMLGDGLVPAMAFFILWWLGRERVPLLPLIAAVAVAIVLQPVKAYYRQVHWGEKPAVGGVVDAWEEAFSLAQSESRSSFSRTQGGGEATLKRLGELSSLAYVVETVPASVPHSGGMVYPMMLTAFVPRVFNPEKPDMTKFALDPFIIALEMADPRQTEASTTGISLVAQGYFEHGLPGSVGWMALFGATAGLLSRYFGTKTAGIISGASMMIGFGGASSGGFFNVFGGLWQTLLGATLFSWLLFTFGGIIRGQRGTRPTLRGSNRNPITRQRSA